MPKVVEYLTVKVGDLTDERLSEIGKASYTFCGTLTRNETLGLRSVEIPVALFTRIVDEYVPYHKSKSTKPQGRPKKEIVQEVGPPPEQGESYPKPLFELNTEIR